MVKAALTVLMLAGLAVGVVGCDDDDDGDYDGDGDGNGSPDNTGSECEGVEDCYPEIVQDDLQGEVVCLQDVEDGYCTHTCVDDADCCAVEGECVSEHPQVCSPFQSNDDKYCFLSCEGQEDGDAYCQEWAHWSFICRSTGGGSENRKVCMPE